MTSDFRPFVGRRVLVFCEFMTFDGTLARTGKGSLVLEHAAAVADDGGRRPIDGDAVIPLESVQWIQVP